MIRSSRAGLTWRGIWVHFGRCSVWQSAAIWDAMRLRGWGGSGWTGVILTNQVQKSIKLLLLVLKMGNSDAITPCAIFEMRKNVADLRKEIENFN